MYERGKSKEGFGVQGCGLLRYVCKHDRAPNENGQLSEGRYGHRRHRLTMIFCEQFFPAGCNLTERVQFTPVKQRDTTIRRLSFWYGGSFAVPPSYLAFSPSAYLRAPFSQSPVPLTADEVKPVLQPSTVFAWTARLISGKFGRSAVSRNSPILRTER